MDYEIYRTVPNGRLRVSIGAQSFPLGDERGDPLDERQVALVLSGYYGEVVQAFARAWMEALPELPPRFGWRGIINSLGDLAEVFPNILPLERDIWREPTAVAR